MSKASNLFIDEGYEQELLGTGNGVTTVFTLDYTPDDPKSVQIFVNYALVYPITHYTISALNVTFVDPPAIAQSIFAVYNKRV